MLAVLAAARDRNDLRVRVDAVLDELGDRLQRVPLRECDDTDRVPVIADPELAAIGGLALPGGLRLRSPRGAIARIGKVYGRHPHSAGSGNGSSAHAFRTAVVSTCSGGGKDGRSLCGLVGSKVICRKIDRKSTRLNSSHSQISYAVFCLQKK